VTKWKFSVYEDAKKIESNLSLNLI